MDIFTTFTKPTLERGGAGGEAERLCAPRALMASPCGPGTGAASATHQGTTGQGEEGGARMACAPWLPTIGDGSAHGDQRPGMCSHQGLPAARGGTRGRDAGQAQPHGEHNPFSLDCSLIGHPCMKTE